ncbi:hypothetical protein ACHAXR_004621 [Thalassiosira sp. AJA248-18]
MGDVTIYLLLDSSLVGEVAVTPLPPSSSAPLSSKSESFQFQSISHVISADASLAELMDFISSRLAAPSSSSESTADTAERNEWIDKLTILDVSYHPAKVISPIVRKYTQVSGPNSKTLHSLGWYPSGKLVVLPSPKKNSAAGSDEQEEHLLNRFLEWQGRNVLQHEEFAYNNPAAANGGKRLSDNGGTTTAATARVQWTGVGATTTHGHTTEMKPSDIFNAVEQRSDHDDNMQQNTSSSSKPKNKKPKRSEKERTQRLDALLQNLDAKSSSSGSSSTKKKKKAVSEKVRTMLLKSRSEGNKKLRMEDRFHLEVVRLWDVGAAAEIDTSTTNKQKNSNNNEGDSGSSYRFFSRQTTAGKVASTMAPSLGSAKAAELLISYPPAGNAELMQHEKRYRRLPNTMSLHDAQTAGWVKDFDMVVVRIYSLVGHECGEFGPSKSVLDPDSDDEMDNDEEDGNDVGCGDDVDKDQATMEVDKDMDESKLANDTELSQESQQRLQQRIHTIFQSLEENNSMPTKKKKKQVSKQMRNMLIKSKSTGNARLKQEDRLYLEVILFHDDGAPDVDSSPYSSSYRFFSRRNDVQHVITVCNSNSSKMSSGNDDNSNACTEFIVSRPSDDAAFKFEYQAIPTALTLEEAIQEGHVENFGRVLIRVCSGRQTWKLASFC